MTKSAKIDLRVTPERKARMEKAAQAEGRTTTGLITYVMDQYMSGKFVLRPSPPKRE